MSGLSLLDSVPLWLVYLLTVALIMVAVEAGYRVGIVRSRRSQKDPEASIDAMVGSTLGLLAFMLAFTFGMATTRFDARAQLVLQEAVAIRTADLRAQMLPEPQRGQMRALIREYVGVRLRGVREPGYLRQAIVRSEELQDVLWSRTTALGNEVPGGDRGALASALVDMIGVHEKRLTVGLYNRINGPIWAALYGLVVMSMGMMGYREGISGRRSILASLALAFAFSAVLVLIVDLDRPQQGLVKVSQQAMLDLQAKLGSQTVAGR
jgi:hypothetical protein